MRVVAVLSDGIGGKPHARCRGLALLIHFFLEDARGVAHSGRPGWNRLDDHRVRADARALAHGEAAEHLRPGADHHARFQSGVPFGALIERGAAQRHALVDGAVVADFRRFTDDHAHAVVDEHAPTNGGAGMNLDAGEPAPPVRNPPPEPVPAALPAGMRHAVKQQGVQARITGDNLPGRTRGRVALQDDLDGLTQSLQHGSVALQLVKGKVSVLNPDFPCRGISPSALCAVRRCTPRAKSALRRA